MEFIFNGKKNQLPIKYTSQVQLSWLLGLEEDDTVWFYFEPQMKISAPFGGKEYMFPIDIWAVRDEDTSFLIAFVDPETEQLIDEHPGVLESLRAHCKALKCEYVPVRQSDAEYVGGQ